MTQPIDMPEIGLIALGRSSLAVLRTSLDRDTGSAAAYLQEAGYVGGDAVHQAFRRWCEVRGGPPPEESSVEEFATNATEFFRDIGWGSISLGTLGESVATLDSTDWSEATDDGAEAAPTCHLSTGMFASFFGRMADAPLAVMEVECRSTGAERCRFLLGSGEVMHRLYDEMANGSSYDEAYVLSASA
jgi:uncharacterized protein